ncbi:hypothetical protein N8587_03450, partial [Akkermansiaceae bacterium]|nr:hypothetical protein [Akkermansiaceae bacterium]
ILIGLIGILVFTKKGFIEGLVAKATFSASVTSSNHRAEIWKDALNKITAEPFFGTGLGFLGSEGRGSTISWFLWVAVESGLVGFLLLSCWLIVVLKEMLGGARTRKNLVCLVGLFAGIVHLSVISGFQHPYLFLLIAYSQASRIRNQKQMVVSQKAYASSY